MNICNTCGRENNTGAFCPNCGTRFPMSPVMHNHLYNPHQQGQQFQQQPYPMQPIQFIMPQPQSQPTPPPQPQSPSALHGYMPPMPVMYTGQANGGETFHTVTVTSKHGDVYQAPPQPKGMFGWFVLGFIIGFSILSIVLMCVWWKDFPNRARGMLIGAICQIAFIAFLIGLFVFNGGIEWLSDQINQNA